MMAFEETEAVGPNEFEPDGNEGLLRGLMRLTALAHHMADNLEGASLESVRDLKDAIGTTDVALMRLVQEENRRTRKHRRLD